MPVWLGDFVFLAGFAATMTAYYQRVSVESSPLTGSWFFLACGVGAAIITLIFLSSEEIRGEYPAGHKLNANRVYHSVYFWWMWYIVLGSLRVLWYWQEIALTITAAGFLAGYVIVLVLDSTGHNPIWPMVVRRYPERTRIP
jgi:hypothetical protein